MANCLDLLAESLNWDWTGLDDKRDARNGADDLRSTIAPSIYSRNRLGCQLLFPEG